jgi:hypothetical protein
MKKALVFLALMVLILMLILSACARVEIEETPVEAPTTEEVITEEPEADVEEFEEVEETEIVNEPIAGETEIVDNEDARMEALISEKIQNCHMLAFILRQNKTAEEWDITITRMIGKGAQINEEEKEMIINWLVARND